MKRLDNQQKNWALAKSKKEIHKRNKKNKGKRIRRKKEKSKQKKHLSLSKKSSTALKSSCRVIAPSILSMFEDATGTLGFFKEVSEKVNRIRYNGNLFFDLSKVEVVSVDAIMYLIAYIKNMKRLRTFQVKCSGNVPENASAKQVFETCGFFQFFLPNYYVRTIRTSDHIKITRGHEADPVLAGQICDFVHSHSNYNRLSTKPLFKMIMELMANTKQHAYSKITDMRQDWYIFVEDTPDYMTFVFLDTGLGIPNTIRTKGIAEKAKRFLDSADAYFISSALLGDFRSETNLGYRGQGLPKIFDRVLNGDIVEFSIISGKGKCAVAPNGSIMEENLNYNFNGTMLNWRLCKNKKEEKYDH